MQRLKLFAYLLLLMPLPACHSRRPATQAVSGAAPERSSHEDSVQALVEKNRASHHWGDSIQTLIKANDGFVFSEKTDTVLYFSNLSGGGCSGRQRIDTAAARKALYRYARSRDYAIETPGPQDDPEDLSLLVLSYDTVRPVQLNGDGCMDAIISFWLTPPYGSSTCYLPQHAMLIAAPGGYRIANADFVPDACFFDSMRQGAGGEAVLYGREFDCGNHVYLRPFRVAIRSGKRP